MKPLPTLLLVAFATTSLVRAELSNLVANGSFDQKQARTGALDDWSSAGNPQVKQRLLLDTGRDGEQCAKLECSEFTGDGPDYHAMICQVGKVGVRRGRWYRLTFWAKGQGIKGGAVEVALSSTRPWENAGLSEAFITRPQWERYEFRFQAAKDVPGPTSRLQFWFKSTGTLWLDDVVFTESDVGQQWYPQIATEGVKNFVPNSSFECGGANWGSFTWGLGGWAGNLYRLEGQVDAAVAQHGPHSLKIALTPDTLPVYWFDYYEPVRQPVRRVLVANRGWFHVKPGEKLTFSAYLRADADGVAAQLAANEAPSRLLRRQVTVGREWHRFEFTFAPAQPFVFVAVGLDLEASKREAATLWIDSVQLERGEHATAYVPRQAVESFVETRVPGNIFTNVSQGVQVQVSAFNNTDRKQTVSGKLTVTDFFDRSVAETNSPLDLPAHASQNLTLNNLCRNQRGFFRATWKTPETSNSIRLALIRPLPDTLKDSPLGFNHAYPWDFLVTLARKAGIVWWRDWSAKWQTVEPEPGHFDFAVPDAQIHRVLGLNSAVEVLLPFPSASWSSTARPDEVAKAAGNDSYLRARLPVAYAPKNLDDFGRYAAEVVRHYRQAQPRRVTHYQILNEPVYTSYALPRKFGYTIEDYVRLTEVAYRAMKAVDPGCQVVGGNSANLDSGPTRDFILKGGLRFVDVFDLHNYDPARSAESFEDSFASLEQLMREHGGPKPIWMTEWGCYADDDPPCMPLAVGDATMNRCRWPSERAATEHIVKFVAIGFAHGLRKIFFHAGTCGPINGPDAGGVLFEYGGAPRKMYAGVAALTELLGVPDECVRTIHDGSLRAYIFRVKNRSAAIAWSSNEPRQLKPVPGVQICDIMGNEMDVKRSILTESPIYLLSDDPAQITKAFAK